MAAIARFGFEGNLIPSNVSMISASFVPSTRNNGTCAESIAVGVSDAAGIHDKMSMIQVETIATNTILYSCQYKMVATNLSTPTTIVQFGDVWIEYDATNNRILFKRASLLTPGYTTLYTSATQALPIFKLNTWTAVNGRFVIGSSASDGEILINIDGTAYSLTAADTRQKTLTALISASQGWTPIYAPQTAETITVKAYGAGGGGWYDYGINEYQAPGGAGGFASATFRSSVGTIWWAAAGHGGPGAHRGGWSSSTPSFIGAGGPWDRAPGGAGGGGASGLFITASVQSIYSLLVAGGGGGGWGIYGSSGYAIGGTSGGQLTAAGTLFQGYNGGGGGYIGGSTGSGGTNFVASVAINYSSSVGGGAAAGISSGGTALANQGSSGFLSVTASLSRLDRLYFGLGSVRSNTIVGAPTFQIDDIAVNNAYTMPSHSTANSTIPPFISCAMLRYQATGSGTVGWTSPNGNLPAEITSSSTYLTASFSPRPKLTLTPVDEVLGASQVEGLNYYYKGAFREGSSNVFIGPSVTIASGSVGIGTLLPLKTADSSGSVSVFEKDTGGKITYSELTSGTVDLNSSVWYNKNFFGRGTLGDVRYTASVNLGDSTVDGDYVVMEYNNLVVDAGVTLTTATRKKGLIIYVKENCILSGSINMDGKAPYSLSNLTNGFVFAKSTSSVEFNETVSSTYTGMTLAVEQLFQPYIDGTTTRFDIKPNYATCPTNGSGQDADGILIQCGAGGSNANNTAGYPSTSYGGGASPNVDGTVTSLGGGIIYLIVGKNLVIASTSTVSANGTYGGGSSGGSGGGCVTVLYGGILNNSGTVVANRSTGRYDANAGWGGYGSVRIAKVITN